MNKKSSLEDKVTGILLATVSGVTCVSGGFMLGWSRARGTSLEYETLMSHGPILLSAGMFGVRGGVEAYSQAVEEPRLPNPLYFAGKVAVGSAAMGGFLSGYNQLFFCALGYGVGWMVN